MKINSESKVSRIKDIIEKYSEFSSLFFLVLVASIYLPTRIDGAITIIALPLIYLFKEKIIAKELKIIFISFLLYLIFFTISSQYILYSSVALVRILRGMLFFAFAQLFIFFLFKSKRLIIHSVFLFIIVMINLFFKKPHIFGNGHFWGYHGHPNTQAFALCFFIILAAILFFRASETAARVINALTIAVALTLLYIANSRSVWFGMIAAGLILLLVDKRLGLKSKIIFSSLAVVAGGALQLWVNKKPPGISGRDVLWDILIEQTSANHPWLGYGLNTNKLILQKFTTLASMSHNSLVEIYSSTGFIGLIAFAGICFFVVLGIYKIKKESSRASYGFGLYGFLTFLAISVFDMKFFDYTFMATICFFIGLVYSRDIQPDSVEKMQ